ncbi:T9SS type A sorting domain-containing protein [Emticicia soli]|uniref:T9SS type A sorting domain-containing protein n=1 Tax=Emticicia soli TaxID=2027878 RepID=A0ABW5J1T0_9BACT
MKKSFLALALILSLATFSFAFDKTPVNSTEKTDPKITVQDISNLRLKVLFDKVAKSTASVQIYNSKGDVFYQDLSETSKPLVLNLSHLEDGAYTLSVVSGDEKLSHDFTIQSEITRSAIIK